MVWTSLDKIVRRNLLEKGYPIHFYAEFLFHAASCLRELTIDTLKIINTILLPVNSYSAIDLPTDFMDDLSVSIPVGGLLHPVPKRDSISPLRFIGPTGTFTTPPHPTHNGGELFLGFNTNWLFFWNINDYGEPTGRYFGATAEGKMNGYKVVKERRQIQLTQTFTSCDAVLMYVSDGQSADAATKIDVLAFSTIQAYINWKRSANADNKDSAEARTYYNERRHLVARLDDITITDIRDIILAAYTASIKN